MGITGITKYFFSPLIEEETGKVCQISITYDGSVYVRYQINLNEYTDWEVKYTQYKSNR